MASTLVAPPSLSAFTNAPLDLSEIRRPVEEEMKAFRRYFRDAMRSKVGILDKVTQYVLRQKGKEIRPILVLLSAEICGGITEASYRAAALVELLHTATLIHDDVVDNAERRRGVFSINALWKNKIAVLLGDFLLSRGLLLALKHNEYDLLHTVSDAVRRMSEGELLQIEKARKLDIDEDTYFRIISDKTASLISACMVCGAVSAGASPDRQEDIREIGEHLGLAFQIRDDLFDYGSVDVGKPLGIDLQEKKMTLPLIASLQHAEKSERKRIVRIVKKRKKQRSDVREVGRFVKDHGGIAYARSKMEGYAADAAESLSTFPESESRDALIGLAAFIVARKN
ncbi:MAG: polyprenyl synthetase family protein [Rubricoccaceae bacterium]|nr:polyprenyl synthetase family protein [Rubricoccaceae bacterium]